MKFSFENSGDGGLPDIAFREDDMTELAQVALSDAARAAAAAAYNAGLVITLQPGDHIMWRPRNRPRPYPPLGLLPACCFLTLLAGDAGTRVRLGSGPCRTTPSTLAAG